MSEDVLVVFAIIGASNLLFLAAVFSAILYPVNPNQ